MKVNGKAVEYTPMTLLEYVLRHHYNPGHIVIERDREIITRERFGEVKLKEDDDINILQFMGGG